MFITTTSSNRYQVSKSLRVAATLGAIGGLVLLAWQTIQHIQHRDAQRVATSAAEAFFSVDYSDPGRWEQSLCALSTSAGCQYTGNILSPALWVDFVRNRTVSTASATGATLVISYFSTTAGTDAQVWRIELVLDAAWPQDPQGETSVETNVLLFRSPNGQWRFDRLLSNEELERLPQ